MPSYTPTIYQNESLYSYIARYHHQSGNTNIAQTLRDIFTNPSTNISLDYPTNLDSLKVDIKTPQKHTNILYHSFFKGTELQNRIVQLLSHGSKVDIHNYLGTKNSRNGIHFLRYCPMCNINNMNTLGECYWSIYFNIIGIDYCAHHNIKLLNSTVSTQSKTGQRYIRCCPSLCPDKTIHTPSVESRNIIELLSNDLIYICNNYSPIKAPKELYRIYNDRLKELGIANKSGVINQIELLRKFSNYYPVELLTSMNMNSSITKDYFWLRSIGRPNNHGSYNPLCHLLFIQLLDLPAEKLVCRAQNLTSEQDKHYFCLNPTCTQYKKPVIDDCTICSNGHSKYYYSFYCPHCYFTYAKYEFKDDFHYDFIKQYGSIWINTLCKMIDNGKSYRQAANDLNVSHPTVKTLYETYKLNIQSYENIDYSKKPKTHRHNSKITYMPPKRTPKEWKTIDNNCLSLLQKALAKLGQNMPPKRITKNKLVTLTGKRSFIQNNLRYLPLAKNFLETYSQSMLDFYKVKIDYMYNYLIDLNQPITIPKLLYLCDIKSHYKEQVTDFIQTKYSLY